MGGGTVTRPRKTFSVSETRGSNGTRYGLEHDNGDILLLTRIRKRKKNTANLFYKCLL